MSISINHNLPGLNGLILAGGESSRMGVDKSLLNYHGKPQREWLFDLLQPFCSEIFLSVKKVNQESAIKLLSDDPDLGSIGPMAGLIMAIKNSPAKAWMIIGCDYPMVASNTITSLLKARSSEYDGVGFKNSNTGLIEPLVTIYEPTCFPSLLDFHQSGKQSLSRFIQTVRFHALEPHPSWITSIDTASEAEKVMKTVRYEEG